MPPTRLPPFINNQTTGTIQLNMFASYPTWHALHHHLHQDAHDQGRHQPQQKTHTHAVIQVIVPGEVPLKHATLPVTQPELHRYKPTML